VYTFNVGAYKDKLTADSKDSQAKFALEDKRINLDGSETKSELR
jgi:hypothetical protein